MYDPRRRLTPASLIGSARALCAAFALIVALPSAASAQAADAEAGFTFFGTEVRGPLPDQIVSLRGKVSLPDLVSTLAPYTLKLSNECDGFCIQVSHDGRELIQIYLDESKDVITGVTSYDPGARDALGNRIGDSLARTIGAQPVVCAAGESTFCSSSAVPGLSYVPSEGDGCAVVQEPGAKPLYRVPPCATIDGFAIWRKR